MRHLLLTKVLLVHHVQNKTASSWSEETYGKFQSFTQQSSCSRSLDMNTAQIPQLEVRPPVAHRFAPPHAAINLSADPKKQLNTHGTTLEVECQPLGTCQCLYPHKNRPSRPRQATSRQEDRTSNRLRWACNAVSKPSDTIESHTNRQSLPQVIIPLLQTYCRWPTFGRVRCFAYE